MQQNLQKPQEPKVVHGDFQYRVEVANLPTACPPSARCCREAASLGAEAELAGRA